MARWRDARRARHEVPGETRLTRGTGGGEASQACWGTGSFALSVDLWKSTRHTADVRLMGIRHTYIRLYE